MADDALLRAGVLLKDQDVFPRRQIPKCGSICFGVHCGGLDGAGVIFGRSGRKFFLRDFTDFRRRLFREAWVKLSSVTRR